jgi:VanZ family protein
MPVTRPLISRLDPWAPPIALMVVIFVLSAQPDLNSGLGTIDLIGRKFVHAGEYALLTVLWWRALRTIATPRAALVLALGIAIGYAVTDECHQHYVSGRHATPVDVLIDATGATIAALVIQRRA